MQGRARNLSVTDFKRFVSLRVRIFTQFAKNVKNRIANLSKKAPDFREDEKFQGKILHSCRSDLRDNLSKSRVPFRDYAQKPFLLTYAPGVNVPP